MAYHFDHAGSIHPAMSPSRSTSTDAGRTTAAITLFVVTASLYFARDVFIPLALALLLSFLLVPLVSRLRRLGLGRTVPVILVMALTSLVLATIAYVFVSQVVDLALELPTYRENIQEKLAVVQHGPLERFLHTLSELETVFALDDMADTGVAPTPVEIIHPFDDRLELFRSFAGPLFAPLAVSALVFIFVVFMLFSWEDLRDRLLRLTGQGQLNLTTEALEDASSRVSHYLAMQLVVNASVGLSVGVGLAVIGVPNAPLWGLLSTTLRFIPYVGPWLGALLPISLTMAFFPGWSEVLTVIGMFVVIELIANNILEPLLYGSSTGVSAIGIVVSAVFWAWLWGPVGLILATPLTVCVMVAGRYVPQLHFLAVLLSDEKALAPDARLYHRLLAMRADDAEEIVDTYREATDQRRLYDDVLLPALGLAERDRHSDALSPERQELVYRGLRAFVGEPRLGRDSEDVPEGAIACFGAEDQGDAISAAMVCRLLDAAQRPAVCLGTMPVSKVIAWIAVHKPRAVLLAATPPMAALSARDRTKKLHALFPSLRIVVGLWGTAGESSRMVKRLEDAGATHVAGTVTDATRVLSEAE